VTSLIREKEGGGEAGRKSSWPIMQAPDQREGGERQSLLIFPITKEKEGGKRRSEAGNLRFNAGGTKSSPRQMLLQEKREEKGKLSSEQPEACLLRHSTSCGEGGGKKRNVGRA